MDSSASLPAKQTLLIVMLQHHVVRTCHRLLATSQRPIGHFMRVEVVTCLRVLQLYRATARHLHVQLTCFGFGWVVQTCCACTVSGSA